MGRLSDNLKGALLMMAAMAAFTLNDTGMKLLGADLPLFQVLMLRGLVTTALVGAVALASGAFRHRLSRRDAVLIGLRTAAEAAAAWLFITALFHMGLATLTAILQALPLTVTLGAALFLREPVGWRRLLAIAVGMAGMLMIVQPFGEAFNLYSVYGLLTVILVTFRDLVVRRISRDVPVLMMTTLNAGGVTLFAAAGLTTVAWAPVSVGDAGLIGLCGLLTIVGYAGTIAAMRVGEVGFVTPFRYFGLLVAIVAGLLVFGDFPNALALAGSAVVVAMGLFTIYRERVARRARPAAEALPRAG